MKTFESSIPEVWWAAAKARGRGWPPGVRLVLAGSVRQICVHPVAAVIASRNGKWDYRFQVGMYDVTGYLSFVRLKQT